MAWIRTIPRSEATGTLKEAYDWQAKRLGEPTEFTQLGSLYPEMVMTRLQLYKTVEGCPSGLSPIERQMAALVTSVLNETPHCSSGLCLKLESLGADRRYLNNMVAYYCYTNRVTNGLGLKSSIGSAREATLALPV